MIVDRYELHGLRCNPFAAEIGQPNAESLFVDRQLPDPPPPGSSTFVQVIGDKGAGKSTQVLAWRRQNAGPYFYVSPTPARRRREAAPIAPLVYADEIDRMPRPLRRRWFRRLAEIDATVVAGTHVDLSGPARRVGLTVVTHRLGPAPLETMRAVVAQRFRSASVAGVRSLQLSDPEIVDIHRRSLGSLRAAELLGHELVAQRVRDHAL